MTVKIDDVELIYPPVSIALEEPAPTVYPGSGRAKIVVEPEYPGKIMVRWGDEIALAAGIAELSARRGSHGIHVFSWTRETGSELRHRNVYIPRVAYGQRYGDVVDPYTVPLEIINPKPALAIVELYRSGTLTIADGVAKWEAPAGGRILKVDGAIGTLGTGAEQTRVQVSNGATDYLTTRGDFVVASATNLMENQVLAALPTFDRGNTIELDIDDIPAGANSATVLVELYCLMFEV